MSGRFRGKFYQRLQRERRGKAGEDQEYFLNQDKIAEFLFGQNPNDQKNIADAVYHGSALSASPQMPFVRCFPISMPAYVRFRM